MRKVYIPIDVDSLSGDTLLKYYISLGYAASTSDVFLSTVSATTFYSGGTDLSLLMGGGTAGPSTFVQGGTNIFTGGTSALPTVNISGASLDNIYVSGNTVLGSTSATTFTSSTLAVMTFTGSTGTTRVMTADEYGQTSAVDELVDLVVPFSTADSNGVALYPESGWTNNAIFRDGYDGQISTGTGELGCSYYCNCVSYGSWKRTYVNPYISATAVTSVLEAEANWADAIITGTTGDVGMRYVGTNYEYVCTSYQTWKRYPTNASYIDMLYTNTAQTFFQSASSWSNQYFIGGQLSGSSEFYEGQWTNDYSYFYHKVNGELFRQPILSQIQSGITALSATTNGAFSGITATTNVTLVEIVGSGDDGDINANFNDLSSQYNKLYTDHEELRTKFNTLLTYLQNHKLIQ